MCASANQYKISRMLYVGDPDGGERIQLFSGRSGTPMSVDRRLWSELVGKGRCDEPIAYAPALHELVKSEILVDKEENEYAEIIRRNKEAADKSKQLPIVIMTTAQCCCACTYCGQQHSTAELSEQHVAQITRLVAAYVAGHDYRMLNIRWFGGEPLLNMGAIRSLTQSFYGMCQKHDLEYFAKLVTNGVLLTKDIVKELSRDLGVAFFELTLDGPATLHDTRRKSQSGAGTFDKIVRGLEALVEVTESMNIIRRVRCNTDCENADSMHQLIDFLADAGFAGKIALYFARIYPWGEAAGQDHMMQSEQFADVELGLAKHAFDKGFLQNLLPARVSMPCIHTDRNGVVISPDCSIYSCTEVPLVPQYDSSGRMIGDNRNRYAWKLGTISEMLEKSGPLRDSLTWYDDLSEYACSDCTLLGVCAGSCPRSWREGRAACPAYKHNLGERLRYHFATAERFKSLMRGETV
jgi:uncharacterized protein